MRRKRLAVSPSAGRADEQGGLVGGQMLPNLITGIVQSAVIFAFGILGLR